MDNEHKRDAAKPTPASIGSVLQRAREVLRADAAAEIGRLRLTDEERDAVSECYEWAMVADHRSLAATLRGLLERLK